MAFPFFTQSDEATEAQYQLLEQLLRDLYLVLRSLLGGQQPPPPPPARPRPRQPPPAPPAPPAHGRGSGGPPPPPPPPGGSPPPRPPPSAMSLSTGRSAASLPPSSGRPGRPTPMSFSAGRPFTPLPLSHARHPAPSTSGKLHNSSAEYWTGLGTELRDIADRFTACRLASRWALRGAAASAPPPSCVPAPVEPCLSLKYKVRGGTITIPAPLTEERAAAA